MASIWVHLTGEQSPRKHIGNMPKMMAIQAFHRSVKEWKADPLNSVRQVFDFEVLMKRNGKLIGSLFIEFHSPPSTPEPGQPRRVAHG